MQRQRSGLDLFPETIDLNQGSLQNTTPSPDNNHPHSLCENTVNQVESRFPSFMRATNDDPSVNPTITNGNSPTPGFSVWDHGESSSSGFNVRDESHSEISKSRLNWPSSSPYNPSSSSENWFFEPLDISANSTIHHGPLWPRSSQSYYSTNRGSLTFPQNHGRHVRESDNIQGHVLGTVLPRNISNPSSSSSSNLGNRNNLLEHNDSSGSAFAAWGGSSCKRKAAEGTSASSSSNELAGKNEMQRHGTICYNNSPGNLIISSGPLNPSPINQSETQSATARFGLTPQNVRSFGARSNLGQETVAHDANVSSSYRGYGVNLAQENLSRPISTSSSGSRPATQRIDPNSSLSRASSAHITTAHPSLSPWNGSLGSQQGGGSSNSHLFEEANHTRSPLRNNLHCPTNVSEAEARNNSVLVDEIDWSFEPEYSSRNEVYGSRGGSNSNAVRASSYSSWLTHRHHQHHHYHQTSQNHHQRFSEAAPWIQHPRIESEAGNNGSSGNDSRRIRVGLIPSVSGSSNEVGSSSRGARNQLDQRAAAALLMDISSDDGNGWPAINAVEERHRLIRQVLHAMRRGVQLQAEDYMVFDPYMDEFAELHDRHRDMRLDVDNMSYEELLALEERIGNVSTGLSEEKIMCSIKQRRHNNNSSIGKTTQITEPCCICQEEYMVGDAIAVVDCGHEFHTSCIKQWLTLKNLCPICKMEALRKT